ncbi:hypothetical protein M758_1G053900, partial [Ceratodon purpureus]
EDPPEHDISFLLFFTKTYKSERKKMCLHFALQLIHKATRSMDYKYVQVWTTVAKLNFRTRVTNLTKKHRVSVSHPPFRLLYTTPAVLCSLLAKCVKVFSHLVSPHPKS